MATDASCPSVEGLDNPLNAAAQRGAAVAAGGIVNVIISLEDTIPEVSSFTFQQFGSLIAEGVPAVAHAFQEPLQPELHPGSQLWLQAPQALQQLMARVAVAAFTAAKTRLAAILGQSSVDGDQLAALAMSIAAAIPSSINACFAPFGDCSLAYLQEWRRLQEGPQGQPDGRCSTEAGMDSEAKRMAAEELNKELYSQKGVACDILSAIQKLPPCRQKRDTFHVFQLAAPEAFRGAVQRLADKYEHPSWYPGPGMGAAGRAACQQPQTKVRIVEVGCGRRAHAERTAGKLQALAHGKQLEFCCIDIIQLCHDDLLLEGHINFREGDGAALQELTELRGWADLLTAHSVVFKGKARDWAISFDHGAAPGASITMSNAAPDHELMLEVAKELMGMGYTLTEALDDEPHEGKQWFVRVVRAPAQPKQHQQQQLQDGGGMAEGQQHEGQGQGQAMEVDEEVPQTSSVETVYVVLAPPSIAGQLPEGKKPGLRPGRREEELKLFEAARDSFFALDYKDIHADSPKVITRKFIPMLDAYPDQPDSPSGTKAVVGSTLNLPQRRIEHIHGPDKRSNTPGVILCRHLCEEEGLVLRVGAVPTPLFPSSWSRELRIIILRLFEYLAITKLGPWCNVTRPLTSVAGGGGGGYKHGFKWTKQRTDLLVQEADKRGGVEKASAAALLSVLKGMEVFKDVTRQQIQDMLQKLSVAKGEKRQGEKRQLSDLELAGFIIGDDVDDDMDAGLELDSELYWADDFEERDCHSSSEDDDGGDDSEEELEEEASAPSSQIKGVSYDDIRNRWKAQFYDSAIKRTVHVGYYPSEEEAANALKLAKIGL